MVELSLPELCIHLIKNYLKYKYINILYILISLHLHRLLLLVFIELYMLISLSRLYIIYYIL